MKNKKKASGVKKFVGELENITNKRLQKTLIITIVVCVLVVITVTLVQLYGQSKIVEKCSYLDPITIDLLAFFAALFLIIEGFFRIIEHPSASLGRQATRIIRIGFGCAIVTLHII